MKRVSWDYHAVVEEERTLDNSLRLDPPEPAEHAREVARSGSADQYEEWAERLRVIRSIEGFDRLQRYEKTTGDLKQKLAQLAIEDTVMRIDVVATYDRIVMHERMHDRLTEDARPEEFARVSVRGALAADERRLHLVLSLNQFIEPVYSSFAA